MTKEKDNNLFMGGVCFITDRSQSRLSCEEMTSMALKAGVRWVQFRDKGMTRRDLYDMALKLRKLTRKYGAFFVVNDYADIAAAVDADGLHLGQEDLPLKEARRVFGKEKIIGVSTHCEDEAVMAEREGADYIGFGPVFHTTTKDAGAPKGTGELGCMKGKLAIPIVAIGGIGVENLNEVISNGARAVAVASSILNGDVVRNTEVFLHKIKDLCTKMH